ncbi:Pyruvate kinase [Methylophaga thiooxydans]|uniref:Pyruvate kinase n=1 Tax=Methylophaga thiooxydans TaxID=392484 RepID=A0A0A0BLR7_9GAMM|nr:pyruvate kinase [Methylophaga thiooxydans]KGM08039.1 Pyruvate kinase [Methylophaga thiooxydans]
MTAIRRTKILATLGPATQSPAVLDAMFEAGMNVVRLNFSHGDPSAHIGLANLVRERAKVCNKPVGILADLQGPKIRIARFKDGKVNLTEGDYFTLDANLDTNAGDQQQVGIDYKALPEDVAAGDTLLLDDGRIVLMVDKVEGSRITTQVVFGGELSNNKGINRQGGGLSAAALTDKDKQDIITAAKMEADYLAVSFPRSADDIHEARRLLQEAGGHAAIVAKIERAEAVDAIEEIITAADAIMVARGDLGVEMGDAALPPIQKRIISMARRMNRITITATQMMESMIQNPIPTRAEVFDVANAVLDGTDAVMLSGETAVGKNPIKTIAAVHRICLQAEQEREIRVSRHRIDSHFELMDEAIAMGAMYLANHLNVKAIAALTESGATTLWMSRISSGIPIFAMTPHTHTARRVTLYRGVYPIPFPRPHDDHATLNRAMIDELERRGVVNKGDIVIITKGDLEVAGSTNALKLVQVGSMIEPQLNKLSCE